MLSSRGLSRYLAVRMLSLLWKKAFPLIFTFQLRTLPAIQKKEQVTMDRWSDEWTSLQAVICDSFTAHGSLVVVSD